MAITEIRDLPARSGKGMEKSINLSNVVKTICVKLISRISQVNELEIDCDFRVFKGSFD